MNILCEILEVKRERVSNPAGDIDILLGVDSCGLLLKNITYIQFISKIQLRFTFLPTAGADDVAFLAPVQWTTQWSHLAQNAQQKRTRFLSFAAGTGTAAML